MAEPHTLVHRVGADVGFREMPIVAFSSGAGRVHCGAAAVTDCSPQQMWVWKAPHSDSNSSRAPARGKNASVGFREWGKGTPGWFLHCEQELPGQEQPAKGQ